MSFEPPTTNVMSWWPWEKSALSPHCNDIAYLSLGWGASSRSLFVSPTCRIRLTRQLFLGANTHSHNIYYLGPCIVQNTVKTSTKKIACEKKKKPTRR